VSRLKPLDLDAPVRALLDAAAARGVTVLAIAEAMGVRDPTIHGYAACGPRVQLSTVQRVADAVGFELVLGFREKST
jgi:hypothetical protein